MHLRRSGTEVSMLTGLNSGEHTWAIDVVRRAVTGILGYYRDRCSISGTCAGKMEESDGNSSSNYMPWQSGAV